MKEMMDTYDIHRQKLPNQRVRFTDWEPGEMMLTAHICIFDDEGCLLIQHRTPDTFLWPDMWDLSAGGAVQAGEDSFTAIRRETLEETGLDIGETSIRARFTLNFVRGFDDFFFVEKSATTGELKNQPDEVSELRWASCEEVIELLAQGKFVPYHAEFLRALFAMRYENGPKRIFHPRHEHIRKEKFNK